LSALKTYRERKGLSLAELAVEAKTTPATLSRIENGKRQPSVTLIKRLIAATGGEVTANDFFPTRPIAHQESAAIPTVGPGDSTVSQPDSCGQFNPEETENVAAGGGA